MAVIAPPAHTGCKEVPSLKHFKCQKLVTKNTREANLMLKLPEFDPANFKRRIFSSSYGPSAVRASKSAAAAETKGATWIQLMLASAEHQRSFYMREEPCGFYPRSPTAKRPPESSLCSQHGQEEQSQPRPQTQAGRFRFKQFSVVCPATQTL